jgi:hypothetical protein
MNKREFKILGEYFLVLYQKSVDIESPRGNKYSAGNVWHLDQHTMSYSMGKDALLRDIQVKLSPLSSEEFLFLADLFK